MELKLTIHILINHLGANKGIFYFCIISHDNAIDVEICVCDIYGHTLLQVQRNTYRYFNIRFQYQTGIFNCSIKHNLDFICPGVGVGIENCLAEGADAGVVEVGDGNGVHGWKKEEKGDRRKTVRN